MKKTLFIFTFLFLTVIVSSCFTRHYVIEDIRFSLAEKVYYNKNDPTRQSYECTSVVKDNLTFIISYHEKLVSNNVGKQIGGSCNATTVGRVIDNPLVERYFVLKFDKPFVYRNEIIEAGTDVLSIKSIAKEVTTISQDYGSFCGMTANNIIDFSQSFFENADFEKGEYEVLFSCEDSREKEFNKTIVITFD